MDKQIFDLIAHNTPKFNPHIADGLAVLQMKQVEQYIDNIIRCAEGSFPEGLKYLRMQRCTPEEDHAQVTLKSGARRQFELSKTNVFLVKLYFSFNKKELFPRYVYLPYVDAAGLITIRGSVFGISPVLTDKAISVGVDNIFIPLTRDKLTFERLPHSFLLEPTQEDIEGGLVGGKRETVYVVWSKIYHFSLKTRRTYRAPVYAVSTLAHYLFSKYGVTRTFAQYAGAEVKVGCEAEINKAAYPEKDWVICYSSGLKPRGVKEKIYNGSGIRLAIRREHYTKLSASLIGGFFYIADHWPERVLPEYIDEIRLWKILLGHAIFASDVSEGKLVEQLDAHLTSLDEYLDPMVKENLREEGIYCNDLYELFVHIIETLSERVRTSSTQVASMYDKRLTVLRYVMLNMVKAIFGFTFKLRSNTKKVLTEKDVMLAMTKSLKRDLIMSINNGHGEVASVSCPGDCKIFKITSNVVLQTNSTGGGRSKSNLDDPAKRLHASIAEVGGFTNLPKSDPTGRSRLNPCVTVGLDGTIIRDPAKAELIDSVQAKIQQ